MRVLFATVELSPLAKVGGLADVAGALPKELRRLGVDIRVVMPLHGITNRDRHGLRRLSESFTVRDLDGAELSVGVWRYSLGDVPVDLLEIPPLFDRPQVYGEADDERRWVVFCDAVLAYLAVIDWVPELIHLNEWHTAFIATRLREQPDVPLAQLPRLYTIHNLAIHGGFSAEQAAAASFTAASLSSELAWEPWVSHSGMGQGLLWSDLINTVSPTYAREILTPQYGAGLDPLLRARADSLAGVLNGIDYQEFDPATDQRLPARFSATDFSGHAINKSALQRRLGLDEDAGVPLIGMVTRLFFQKGADLAVEAVQQALETGSLQLAVLGTGDQQYHDQLTALAERHPGRVAIELAFDVELAQLIYGGSDMFLMPSRFEPCGLGQLIALRYGSVPIVRRTGGLADTVREWSGSNGSGNGFVFESEDAGELAAALQRAMGAFLDAREWHSIVAQGMAEDHSWTNAAAEYGGLYERARAAVSAPGNPARTAPRVTDSI